MPTIFEIQTHEFNHEGFFSCTLEHGTFKIHHMLKNFVRHIRNDLFKAKCYSNSIPV